MTQEASEEISRLWGNATPQDIRSALTAIAKIFEKLSPYIDKIPGSGAGKRILDRAEAVDTAARARVISSLRQACQGIEAPDEVTDKVISIISTGLPGWFPIAMVASIVVGILITTLVKPAIQGGEEKITNWANSKWRPHLDSPDVAFKALMMGGHYSSWPDSATSLGLDPAAESHYNIALRPWWNAEDVNKIASMYNLDSFQCEELWKRLGYLTDTPLLGKGKLGTLLPYITGKSADTALLWDLHRRGKLDYKELEKRLGLCGYDKAMREMLSEIWDSPFPIDTVTALRNRQLIDDKEMASRLRECGLSDDNIKLMQSLRFRTLDINTINTLYHRGLITRAEWLNRCLAIGISDRDTILLEQASWHVPAIGDLIHFAVREVFTPAIASRFGQFQDYPQALTEWGKKAGAQEDILRLYWAAHWELPSVEAGFDMLHRGIISDDDLNMLMRARDIMPFWREKRKQAAHSVIPYRTVAAMRRYKVIDLATTVELLQKVGYTFTDALLLCKLADAQSKNDKKDLTLSETVEAYASGFLTRDQYKTYLNEIGYEDTELDYFLAFGDRKKAAYDRTHIAGSLDTATFDAQSKTRDLLLRMFRWGMIDDAALRSGLIDIGIPEQAADFYVSNASAELAQEEMQRFADNLRKQYLQTTLSDIEAQAKLTGAGFTPTAAMRLVREWGIEYETAQAIKAANPKMPSKAEIDAWLVNGVISVETWIEYMQRDGYADTEIENYLVALAIKMGA